MKKLDLIGKRFGRWRVIGTAPRSYQTMWECVCDCGAVRQVSGANLTTGHSTSCGCFREENRPNLAKSRDYRGSKNPRAKRSADINGGVWVPASSIWYKRAAGIFYSAKNKGIPLGFKNVAELATYIKSIAPYKCPVFNKKFVERGNGFSKWSPSIDKINPKKGYIRGNIQVISMMANCMKRDATAQELRQFAGWVLQGD
jgi:hypothetical protein